MRAVVVIAAGVFLWSDVLPTSAQAPTLASRLETLRTSANLPAAGGVLFRSDGGVEVAAVGVRRLGDPAAVTPDDLWHVGSITKSFTSALVAKFVERGDFAWTSTLGDLVGAERARKFSPVTLLNLLSHRAGLPPNVTPPLALVLSQQASPVDQRQRILQEVLAGEPASAPGETYAYSNLGYVIAGAILELRTGKAWEDLVRAEILSPLGLTSVGFGAPGAQGALTQPRGHRRQTDGGLLPVEPGPFADNRPYLGPAGTLHMTLADLARWGREHLRGERGQDGLLHAATFRRLHEPPRPDATYALGWVVRRTGDRRAIWHNGSNTMWYAIVAFDPDADLGAVVVTNGSIGAARAVDATAFALLDARSARR